MVATAYFTRDEAEEFVELVDNNESQCDRMLTMRDLLRNAYSIPYPEQQKQEGET